METAVRPFLFIVPAAAFFTSFAPLANSFIVKLDPKSTRSSYFVQFWATVSLFSAKPAETWSVSVLSPA